MRGAINEKFLSDGDLTRFGFPISNETRTPNRPGAYSDFEKSSIYWSPNTKASEILGSIRDKWTTMRREDGVLGFPKTDELWAYSTGKYNDFEHGAIYWSPDLKAHAVQGRIFDKWNTMKRDASILGLPVSDEYNAAGGKASDFQRGTIYWSGKTDAHEVHGNIANKYLEMGLESGKLGFPTSDERKTARNAGAFNDFDGPGIQGASIYWSKTTNAHEVQGVIRNKWRLAGAENSYLGFPITDETPTPVKPGSFNHFQGGSIYWSLDSDAHEVRGNIRDKWQDLGWENSLLGFPMTDEIATPTKQGAFNHFQGGSVYWSPTTNAHEVHGAIRDGWASTGWENSDLGFPTTDEEPVPGGRRSYFQGGYITFDFSNGQTSVVRCATCGLR